MRRRSRKGALGPTPGFSEKLPRMARLRVPAVPKYHSQTSDPYPNRRWRGCRPAAKLPKMGFTEMGLSSIICMAVAALGLSTSSQAQCPNFGAATNFEGVNVPVSAAIGDFNGDGQSDLAVVNSNWNNVSILLGSGTGTFGEATNFATGTAPGAVAISDFNGDGKSDLVVPNRSSNNVSILIGTGTGSFGAPTNFSTGPGPSSVAISDFNDDGKSDLAVSNQGSNTVSILIGTGTGTFVPATNFVAGTAPASVAISDFNGDGRSDLSVANFNSHNVSILLGTGSGTFGAATNFATGMDKATLPSRTLRQTTSRFCSVRGRGRSEPQQT